MTKAYVAITTEQASNFSGFVTVIDGEPSVPSGVVGVADGASTALLCQHPGISAVVYPVVLQELVILNSLRVLLSPLARSIRDVVQIVSAPAVVPSCGARFAFLLQPVPRPLPSVEVGRRLNLFTRLARLGAGLVDVARRSRLKLLLLFNRAGFAVVVVAVLLRAVLVELIERFFGLAGGALLHRTSPLPSIIYNTFQPVNGARYAT